MARPKRRDIARDTVIFVIGVGITIGQTGFPWLLEAPEGGPNIWALATGALFCNGPVVLQALALRFGGGTSSSGPASAPSLQPSPSEPSPAPSSGAE